MQPIILPLNELRPALTGFGKVISKRASLPVLGCVRLQRHATGAVDLTVTDLDHAATCRLAGPSGAPPLTLVLPLEDLANVARSGGAEGAIEIEPFDDGNATLRFQLGGQPVEHRCETRPPEEFPSLPDIAGDSVPLPPQVCAALHDALTCASTDSARRVLNGACVDVSQPGAHHIVATDGRHLFSANSFRLPLQESVIIPDHKFLGWKGFQQDGEWRLRTGRAETSGAPLIELSSGRWRFVARGIDGTFPNWRQVIPETGAFKTAVTLPPDAVEPLTQSVQRLPVPVRDLHQTVGLEVADGAFRLLGRSRPDMDWTRLRVDAAEVRGPAVTVLLDRTYLLKALRLGLTRIELIDAVSPVQFSQGGRILIAMPLRAPVPTPAPEPVPEPAQASEPKPEPTPNPPSPPAAQADPTTEPATGRSTLERALDQIEALRSGLRELLQRLTPLHDSLRQALREQRAGDKDLQSVRQTLRTLQNVRL